MKCCHSVPKRGKHCIHCGARFTLTETGEVQVGKPYAELEDAAEFAETEATHLQAQVDALIDYLVTEPVQIPPGYEGDALVWEPAALWVEWAATEATQATGRPAEHSAGDSRRNLHRPVP